MTLEMMHSTIRQTQDQIANLEYELRLATAGAKQAVESFTTTDAGAQEIVRNLLYLAREAPVVLLSEWRQHKKTMADYRYLLDECRREQKRRGQQIQKAEEQLITVRRTLQDLERQLSSWGEVVEIGINEHR